MRRGKFKLEEKLKKQGNGTKEMDRRRRGEEKRGLKKGQRKGRRRPKETNRGTMKGNKRVGEEERKLEVEEREKKIGKDGR